MEISQLSSADKGSVFVTEELLGNFNAWLACLSSLKRRSSCKASSVPVLTSVTSVHLLHTQHRHRKRLKPSLRSRKFLVAAKVLNDVRMPVLKLRQTGTKVKVLKMHHHPRAVQGGLAESTAAASLIFILCGNNEATHDVTRLHIARRTGCNTRPCARLMSPDGEGGACRKETCQAASSGKSI